MMLSEKKYVFHSQRSFFNTRVLCSDGGPLKFLGDTFTIFWQSCQLASHPLQHICCFLSTFIYFRTCFTRTEIWNLRMSFPSLYSSFISFGQRAQGLREDIFYDQICFKSFEVQMRTANAKHDPMT